MKSKLTVSTSSLHEWSIESGVYDNWSTELLQPCPFCYNKNMKEDTWHLFQDITEPKIEYLHSTHEVASSEMTYIVTKLLIFDCEPFTRKAWVQVIPY